VSSSHYDGLANLQFKKDLKAKKERRIMETQIFIFTMPKYNIINLHPKKSL
jgi:hypothetical protein